MAAGLVGQAPSSPRPVAAELGPAPAAAAPEFLAAIEPPLLRSAFARCAEVLSQGDPALATPRERAFLLLGWLRLDQTFRARAVLEAAASHLLVARHDCATGHDDDAAAWFAVQTYWYWRARRDETVLRSTSSAFARARDRLRTAPLPDASDRAILYVHALACAEAVSRILGQPDAGIDCSLRARRALDDHERAHWHETRSCFADGESEPSLFGCAIGMLAATADRMDRHVRTALRVATLDSQDDELVARTQFDLERAHELEAACTAAVDAPSSAGQRLDALAFAATGLRLATGPGLDERWTRVRPCLLPNTRELRLRGLRADGFAVDLAAERDGDAVVLRARLSPETEPATWRQLVAHLEGRVFVTAARADTEVVLRSRDAAPAAITSPTR